MINFEIGEDSVSDHSAPTESSRPTLNFFHSHLGRSFEQRLDLQLAAKLDISEREYEFCRLIVPHCPSICPNKKISFFHNLQISEKK